MKIRLVPLFSVLCLAFAFAEATNPGKPIPRGSTIFIEAMEHDLDGYIRAEMVKQKVRLQIVLDPEEARFIMTGSTTEKEKRRWHSGWLTPEQDRTAGNVMVIDQEARRMVWAGEAGDRSLWWGSLKRGGHRKVAQRLVKNLKRAVQ